MKLSQFVGCVVSVSGMILKDKSEKCMDAVNMISDHKAE
jgi:hypothetical protein